VTKDWKRVGQRNRKQDLAYKFYDPCVMAGERKRMMASKPVNREGTLMEQCSGLIPTLKWERVSPTYSIHDSSVQGIYKPHNLGKLRSESSWRCAVRPPGDECRKSHRLSLWRNSTPLLYGSMSRTRSSGWLSLAGRHVKIPGVAPWVKRVRGVRAPSIAEICGTHLLNVVWELGGESSPRHFK